MCTWGKGEDGQLGHGSADDEPLPKAVLALLDYGIKAIACGAEYTVAVSSEAVYSWGW